MAEGARPHRWPTVEQLIHHQVLALCLSLYDAYLPMIALLLRDPCVLRSNHRASSARGNRTVRPRRK